MITVTVPAWAVIVAKVFGIGLAVATVASVLGLAWLAICFIYSFSKS